MAGIKNIALINISMTFVSFISLQNYTNYLQTNGWNYINYLPDSQWNEITYFRVRFRIYSKAWPTHVHTLLITKLANDTFIPVWRHRRAFRAGWKEPKVYKHVNYAFKSNHKFVYQQTRRSLENNYLWLDQPSGRLIFSLYVQTYCVWR